jgi:hypothetical protein
MRCRFTAGLLTVALAAGLFTLGGPRASASSNGRKNTTLGLGALAAYELLRGNTGTGLLAGAGTASAYKRYSDARKDDRRSRRYYRSRYRNNNGSFQFPSQYSDSNSYGNSGYQYAPGGYYGKGGYQYQNNGYQYQNTGYQYQPGGSYTTDEWGNRHYYNPQYGDGYHQYGVGYSDSQQCRHGRHSRR